MSKRTISHEKVVFISLIPNVIEAMSSSWLIDECFFICETYYIQQKTKKKGRLFAIFAIMDMFTHTDIFSTLHTQETWNVINLYQRLIGLII